MVRLPLLTCLAVLWMGMAPLSSSAMYQPQTVFSPVTSPSQGAIREQLESRLFDFARVAKKCNERDDYFGETGDVLSVYVLTDPATFLRFQYIDLSSGFNFRPNDRLGREDVFTLYLLHRPLFVYRPNQLVMEAGRVVYDGRLLAFDVDGHFHLPVNDSGLQEGVEPYVGDYL